MEFNKRVLAIAEYPSAALAERKRVLAAAGKPIFDFGTGDPIEPTAAFIRAALSKGVPEVSQYPSVRGTLELRKAAAAYLARRFRATLDPETEILPCTGSKEAIFNITNVLIGPESSRKTVIGAVPGYFVMERSSIVGSATYYPVQLAPTNKWMLELAELPESVLRSTAIAWINYPHNPTGAQCSLEYLKRQVDTAKKYDILLCSDECYVDLYLEGAPPPSVLEIANKGVLAFHSCSKRSGMTAYRSGFIAGDREVLKVYSDYRNTLGVATPIYTQRAATAAWGEDTHVAERRAIFKSKRDQFRDFLRDIGLAVTQSDATFYLWIETPPGLTGTQYAAALLEEGIVVSPGEFFGGSQTNYIRVALVPSLEDCKQATEVWRRVHARVIG